MRLFLIHTKERIPIMNQQIKLSGVEITFLGKASEKTLGTPGSFLEFVDQMVRPSEDPWINF